MHGLATDLLSDAVDLGLVEEFQTASSFARQPVKITMTGPHLLAAVAHDEYYNDTIRMIGDFGKLLHQNFRRLVEAGCKHIQIDEPYFTVASDQEVRAAVDAINMAVEGLPDDVHVMVHICQGNYAVGPDYDGQIGHRYFDQGRYKAYPAGLLVARARSLHLPPRALAILPISANLPMQPWSRPLRRALPETSPILPTPRRCKGSELP